MEVDTHTTSQCPRGYVNNTGQLEWFQKVLAVFFRVAVLQWCVIQLLQIVLSSVDVGYVLSSGGVRHHVGAHRQRALLQPDWNLDFRPCPGDGVLIGFQHDFQLKVHVGLGELFLSFGGFLFALPEVYETWQIKKELYAANLEKTMTRLIGVSAMLQIVPYHAFFSDDEFNLYC